MAITLDEARRIFRKGPLSDFFHHGNNMVTAMMIDSGRMVPTEEPKPVEPQQKTVATATQDN